MPRRTASGLVRLARVPYAALIAAGLSALIGFYVTHVIEELRTGATASYEFVESEDGFVLFNLDNLSRVHTIDGAYFYIWCDSGLRQRSRTNSTEVSCFESFQTSEGDTFVESVQTPPNFGNFSEKVGTQYELQICLGAIPGSRSSVRFRPSQKAESFVVLYDPWQQGCKVFVTSADRAQAASGLYLLESSDPHAVAAKYYFQFFSLAFAFSILVILLLFIGYFLGDKDSALRKGQNVQKIERKDG